jgi:hypothetical protein
VADLMPTGMQRAVSTSLRELHDGSAMEAAWMLNPEEARLLRSLDQPSTGAASAAGPGEGSSIAAHVDHLRYSLELLNRWSHGESPFADANGGAG